MLLRTCLPWTCGIALAALLTTNAGAQTPLEDLGFTPVTPLPFADAVIVRERAYGAGGVDLSSYGMGTPDYVQSIYFRFFTDANPNQFASFTGRIVFPQSVQILGIIVDGTDLGGELDDGALSESDSLFAVGPADDYSAPARGFESSGEEFVCQTDTDSIVFGLNITNGVDDFRVIVDYGTSFPAGVAFDVASNGVTSFGGVPPSTGFQVGKITGPNVLGSGFFDAPAVLRVPLTSQIATNTGPAIPSDPAQNLWILRSSTAATIHALDIYNLAFRLPQPRALTIASTSIGTPIALAPGPDRRLYAIGVGGGYTVIDTVTRTPPDQAASQIEDKSPGDNVDVAAIPGSRHLLFLRGGAPNDTYLDRFDVDSRLFLPAQSHVIPSTTLVPKGIAVKGGFAYVLGAGGKLVRVDLSSNAQVSFTAPATSGYIDLEASSSHDYLFLLRTNATTFAVDRFDCSSQQSLVFANTNGSIAYIPSPAGICEGPNGFLYVLGVGSGGAPGFARIDADPAASVPLPMNVDCGASGAFQCHACIDFGGGNIDLAFVAPFEDESYCTAKLNSQGCLPAISSSGEASATSSSPFTVSASQVLNQKNGILFYGLGPNDAPFLDGVLCVAQPSRRTMLLSSGGNPMPDDCSGAFSFDFQAHIQSGVDVTLTPSADVYAQYWYRDPAHPAQYKTGLSNGLFFRIAP